MTCKSESPTYTFSKHQSHTYMGLDSHEIQVAQAQLPPLATPKSSSSLDVSQLITITRQVKSVILTPCSLGPLPAPHLLLTNWPPSPLMILL